MPEVTGLIEHLWRENRDEILIKSILHCHQKHVHSIMLLEAPERTIRLYIAMEGHELYKNYPHNWDNGMSIAFHPHHCNLTIHVLKGYLRNITGKPVTEDQRGYRVSEYRYTSQITSTGAKFEKLCDCKIQPLQEIALRAGDMLHLEAKEIHTVACDRNTVTAWLVYEGKEDRNYKPLCYTNVDPNTQIDGLYQKPTEQDIKELLEKIGCVI